MRYNLVGLSSIVPVFSSTLFRTPDTNFYVSAVSASLVHAMLAHPDIEVRYRSNVQRRPPRPPLPRSSVRELRLANG
jgi:hypothetical protein